jgi:hypothetical protein
LNGLRAGLAGCALRVNVTPNPFSFRFADRLDTIRKRIAIYFGK